MKKKMRKAGLAGFVLAVVAAGILAGCAVPGATPQTARIYDSDHYRVHPLSQIQLMREWGRPLTIMPLDSGVVQWVYALNPSTVGSYQYFLIRQGQVIQSGIWITDVSG